MPPRDPVAQKNGPGFLPKLIFVLGLVMVVGAGLVIGLTSSIRPSGQSAQTGGTESDVDVNAVISGAFADLLSGPQQRWERDQAALPVPVDDWAVVITQGGGQSRAVAGQVYAAMHDEAIALDSAALADLAAAQQPGGMLSDVLGDAQQAMQAVGVSEQDAQAQTSVNPLFVQLGDGIARKNDLMDQGRVYLSGDQVIMIMIRRLPQGYRSKQSWLQETGASVGIPVTIAGQAFVESPRTANRDDRHALRLDITDDLFIEVGGRVDRPTLEQFISGIDFAAL